MLLDFVWKTVARRRAAYADWVLPPRPAPTGPHEPPPAVAVRDDRSVELADGRLGHSATDETREFYATRQYPAPDIRDVFAEVGDDE